MLQRRGLKLIVLIIVIIAIVYGLNKYLFKPGNLNLPKKENESTYKLYWTIIPIGEAKIDINKNAEYNDKKQITITLNAETKGLIEKIADLSIESQSVVDKNTKLPIIYKETIYRNNKIKESKTLKYNQKKHLMHYEDDTYIITPETYDPLSVLLYFKNKNISKGEQYVLNINCNQSNYKVSLDVASLITAGNNNLYVLKGKSERKRGRKSRHRTEFTIYLDSRTKIPVLIKAFTPFGPVRMKLINK
jgi:hypothetical protein